MTHSDIKEKFMIEYDKANIASSYPSLTEYEIATILDKAYLAIIAQKLTGNNPRGVAFEGDTKAIEDIRPLIDRINVQGSTTDTEVSNEVDFKVPDNFLYYLQSRLSTYKSEKSTDSKYGHLHDKVEVNLVTHELASKYMNTTHNMPWVPTPVCCLEGNMIRVFFDPMKYSNQYSLQLGLVYIKQPAKFTSLLDGTPFELSDTMAEELINLAIIMATESVESPRLSTKLQTRQLES